MEEISQNGNLRSVEPPAVARVYRNSTSDLAARLQWWIMCGSTVALFSVGGAYIKYQETRLTALEATVAARNERMVVTETQVHDMDSRLRRIENKLDQILEIEAKRHQ